MSLLLNALNCVNERRPPVWLMRQAGRYLPQYRKIKEGRALFEMMHDPETVVKVTLLPVDLLQVDAAILFSDILTVLDGLGISYHFHEGIGPVIEGDEIGFKEPEEAYRPVIEAIRQLKRELTVPLLGFAGAPFTIASYIIEGKTSRDFKKTKKKLFCDPKGFSALLSKITDATIAYLNCQIDAGVDAVQLFDSWAMALAPEEFRTFSLEPVRAIVNAVKKRGIPIILFCRGSSPFAKPLAELGPSAISLDWSCDLAATRSQIPPTIALQGNLDPMALFAPQAVIRQKIERLLNQMEGSKGYLFNLGHGLLPDTPVENVHFLVDYVRSRAWPT